MAKRQRPKRFCWSWRPVAVMTNTCWPKSTAAWTSAVTNGGLLSVAPAAALEGSYGLRAEISNTNDLYVLDTTPSAATSYNARFRFDPNDVSLSFLRSHDLFVAASGTATAVVEMRSLFGWYQVRVGARLDNGSTRYTSWTGLTDDVHVVELGWVASSGGGSNGTIRLWIDGAEVASATALANGAQRVDDARLGPQSVPSRTSGVEYFDGFVSTLGTYIGP